MFNVCEEYAKWYDESKVWKNIYYRGVRTLKNVSDMWNYQEIFYERDIEWVLETGTRHGGSALFFADLLSLKDAKGEIITIDIASEITSELVFNHPKIKRAIASSIDDNVLDSIFTYIPKERGRLFLILDSDHRKEHVLEELRRIVPRLNSGDYIIVEDSNINGHPVRPDFGPGPYEAIEQYLIEEPSMLIADKNRELKFGFTFAPNGYFIKS